MKLNIAVFNKSRPSPIAPSALIFDHYAREIEQEQGDVFQRNEAKHADHAALKRLLDRFRDEKAFADENLIDEVWQEELRYMGILSDSEQQEKDEYTLAKARSTKEALRESGLSDAPRFGFCKRTGCTYRKTRRLLRRGFCPDCRGVSVKQAIADGGTFDGTGPSVLLATKEQMQTSLTVVHKDPHAETEKETTQEKIKRVLTVKEQNPAASQREIARITNIPRVTVQDILKSQSVKQASQTTLNSRIAESAPEAEVAAGDWKQTYVIAETGHSESLVGVETGHAVSRCPNCQKTVIPALHFWMQGNCMPILKAATLHAHLGCSDGMRSHARCPEAENNQMPVRRKESPSEAFPALYTW